MAKAKAQSPTPQGPVKVIAFFKEGGGAFGFAEIEIDSEVLSKSGKVLFRSNPDVFNIFESQLIRKAREIFGL